MNGKTAILWLGLAGAQLMGCDNQRITTAKELTQINDKQAKFDYIESIYVEKENKKYPNIEIQNLTTRAFSNINLDEIPEKTKAVILQDGFAIHEGEIPVDVLDSAGFKTKWYGFSKKGKRIICRDPFSNTK